MPQQHLDRLTAVDASFLAQEGTASHMHVGAVLVFDGAPPDFERVLDSIRGRLHLVPRYRQKLATPPLETGRPLWVDDQNFNLEFHVRHTALPAPGSEEQLLALAARIHSQPLDRTKPLWELWMVEGLCGDAAGSERFALVSKTHHSVVDGVSGVDLATVIFDPAPEGPAPHHGTELEPWRPRPSPTSAEMAVAGIRDVVVTAAEAATRALAGLLTPHRSVDRLKDAVEGIGEIVWAELNPAPSTPLNGPIGPYRRFAVVRQSLADYKLVKGAFGGTVNDVVLTVVSGALARWLQGRSVRTEGLELRALVPVSVRGTDQHHTLGNQLTVMRGPLPVYVRDPVARLDVVRAAMDDLKDSKQAIGASTLTAAQTLAPPTVLAQASRLNFSTRLFNLLVTNIPGPQLPLYLLGHKLQDLFPIGFLAQNHMLCVALMSYNGHIGYGLLGDFDAMDDIAVVAKGIEAELSELIEAARAAAIATDGATAVVTASTAGATTASTAGATTASTAGATTASTAGATTASSDGGAIVTATREQEQANRTTQTQSNGKQPPPLLPTSTTRSTGGPAADMRAKRARARAPRGSSR